MFLKWLKLTELRLFLLISGNKVTNILEMGFIHFILLLYIQLLIAYTYYPQPAYYLFYTFQSNKLPLYMIF